MHESIEKPFINYFQMLQQLPGSIRNRNNLFEKFRFEFTKFAEKRFAVVFNEVSSGVYFSFEEKKKLTGQQEMHSRMEKKNRFPGEETNSRIRFGISMLSVPCSAQRNTNFITFVALFESRNEITKDN